MTGKHGAIFPLNMVVMTPLNTWVLPSPIPPNSSLFHIQVAAGKQHSFPPALLGAHAAGLTSHTVTPTKVVLAKRGDEVESAFSLNPFPSKFNPKDPGMS